MFKQVCWVLLCLAGVPLWAQLRPIMELDFQRGDRYYGYYLDGSGCHTGADYTAFLGAPLPALTYGRVSFINDMNPLNRCVPNRCDGLFDHGMGRVVDVEVLLENGDMMYASYNHMQGFGDLIGEDLWVTRRQTLGYMGGSGQRSDSYWGPHLHLEMRVATNVADPTSGILPPWGYVSTPGGGCSGLGANHTDHYGYRDPEDYIQQQRALIPFLSRDNTLPAEDDYDVYGIAGQALYGFARPSGAFYHAAILVRASNHRDHFDHSDKSAQPKYVAQAGSDSNTTSTTVVHGISGDADFDPGDYLFVATVAKDHNSTYQRHYGFPLLMRVLAHEQSVIVDNDQINHGNARFETSVPEEGEVVPGYFTSARMVPGQSNHYARWRPGAAGRYRIWVHLPQNTPATELVYQIKEDGGDTTLSLAQLDDRRVGSNRWVALNSPDRNLFDFTAEGFVGLFLGTDPAMPAHNAHLTAAVPFDAVWFEYVEDTSQLGHYRNGWQPKLQSQAFVDAFHQYGGTYQMGAPVDNGGGDRVHWWGPGQGGAGEGVWIQDFLKTHGPRYGSGETALIYSPRRKRAFLVKDVFWDFYKRHHGYRNFGAPRADEITRGNVVFQLFEKGMLRYDTTTGRVSRHLREDHPATPPQPLRIQSSSPGTLIYNHGVLLGQTPLDFEACQNCAYEMGRQLTAKSGAPETFRFVARPDTTVVVADGPPEEDLVTLAGRVTNSAGLAIWDVVISGLDGNPRVDNSGRFAVQVPRGWSGTLVPQKDHYSFQTPSRTIQDAQTDISDLFFTGTKAQPEIPLRVTSDGQPLAGVWFNGLSGQAVSDANGRYTTHLPVGWQGVIRPRLRGFFFSPSSLRIDDLDGDLAEVVFVATARTSTVSGTILHEGSGLAGVVLQGLPGNPTTDASGVYEAQVPYEWSDTVTPVLEGFSFIPPGRTYLDMKYSEDEQDFTAVPLGYAVSGSISVGGAAVDGVWLAGLPGAVLSDAAGGYTSLVQHGWSETITPLKLGYRFNPSETTPAPVINDLSGLNFGGSLIPGERRIWVVDNVPDFNYAAIIADPGDIIVVKPGTYVDPRFRNLHEGVTVISEAGAAQTIMEIGYFVVNNDFTVIDGFTFQSSYSGEMIFIASAENVQIKNCLLRPRAGEYAIRVQDSYDILLTQNHFGTANGRGILLRRGSSGALTIANNVFEGSYYGIDGGNDPGLQLTVENNLFLNNIRAIDVSDIASATIRNNLIVGSVTRGMDLSDVSSTINVYQNTFVGNERAAEIGTNALMYNNLFKDNNRNIDGNGANPNITIHHTLHHPGNLLYCCANFNVDTNTTHLLDPMFVNQAAGDYHLSPASPARGSGQNGYDMGAYGGPLGSNWPSVPGTPMALPTLTDFQIDGPMSVPTGQNFPMEAKAFYAGNYFARVTAQSAWTSSDPTILAVLGAGRFLANRPGGVTLTATFAGQVRDYTLEVLNSQVNAASESRLVQPPTGKLPTDPELQLFVNYANQGEGNAGTVVVTVDYDPNFTFLSAEPAPDPGSNGTWTIPAMRPAESGVLAIVGSIPADLGNNAAVVHDVAVTAQHDDGVAIVEVSQIPGAPRLAMSLTPPSLNPAPGAPFQVGVLVENLGTAAAQNVLFHMSYPETLLFVEADRAREADNLWDIPLLEPGGTRAWTLTLMAEPGAPPLSLLEALATLQADFQPTIQAPLTVSLGDASADIAVRLQTSTDQALAGLAQTWWLVIENHGPSVAQNLTLSNNLPQTSHILSSSHLFSSDAQVMDFALGGLAPGETSTAVVLAEPLTGGVLDVTASVSASQQDPYADNNSHQLSVPLTHPPEGVIDSPSAGVSILTGQTVHFSATADDADGHTPLGYLWDFGGGAPNSTSEDPGDISFTIPGTYTVTLNLVDSMGTPSLNPDSRVIVVQDNLAPTVTIDQPGSDRNICAGESVSFLASADDPDGHLPLSFHWSFDGGADDRFEEDPGSISFHRPGTFQVTLTVRDAHGLAQPGVLRRTVTVRAPVAVSTQPVDQVGCGGEDMVFTVGTTGSAPLTYQWRKDGLDLPGEQDPSLALPAIDAADAGAYDCVVSNACGQQISGSARLTVNEAVTIVQSPTDTDICRNQSATFNVDATGTAPLVFQWRKNGTPIPGAVDNTFTIPTVTAENAAAYDCLVTNPCGNRVSALAMLDVLEPIQVTSHPPGREACAGDTTSFSATATGEAPLSYQWQFNGVDIAGATANTLHLNNLSAGQAGTYRCRINNPCGEAITGGATLVVRRPLALTAVPTDTQICNGESVAFGVAASGTTPITYQWRKDGVDLPGATSPTYELPDVEEAHAGAYTCVVVNPCGSLTTTAADLTVLTPVGFNGMPQDEEACLGDTVLFSVLAEGSGPIRYQWLRNGVEIEGANNPTLNISNVTPAQAGTYTCRLENTCTSLLSQEAQLQVSEPATIAEQPINQQACEGETASFSISASGTGPFLFQWNKDGNPLPGENDSSLSLPTVSATEVGVYTCTVTTQCGGGTSEGADLSVLTPINLTGMPQDTAVCVGTAATFSVTAQGSDPISYQWQWDGTPLAGATASTYTINPATHALAGAYTCRVTNSCGTVQSPVALLQVFDPIAISAHPLSQQSCEGEEVNFTVTASGSDPTYQWYKNGNPLEGANDRNLVLPAAAPSDAGVYTCEVSGNCGEEISAAAVLSLLPRPQITDHPMSQNLCPEDPLILSVTVPETVSYQWRKNGLNLNGQITSQLTLPLAMPSDSGFYDCVISHPCGNHTSNAAEVVVAPDLTAAIHPLGAAQGIFPIWLEANIDCPLPPVTWDWHNLTDGTLLASDVNPLPLAYLDQSSRIQLTVRDSQAGSMVQREAVILVPPQIFVDLDGDGCNSLADFFLLAQDWGRSMHNDPSGNGLIDVLDFLYINLDDEGNCP